MTARDGGLRVALLLALFASLLRVAWALAVPTIPVGDFAMYRESANYLVEHGRLDSGFIYMPGLVLVLAALQTLGGEIVAAKLAGAAFGGLAAAPLYILTAHLTSSFPAPKLPAPPSTGVGGARSLLGASPVALVATALYAVWPAGIALASVIGTDVPAGALLLLAFALLLHLGPARPMLAAAAFGAAMGLAAYFRAVALPLGALSAGYWLARRAGARAVVARTSLAVGVTLLVLAPWAVRNLRTSGELAFTDSHGGVTALMGNYPNSEGTYARSLGLMFKELTGRTLLSEPHRETDRIAYNLAKTWIGFEPGWTAGMIALRLERLFAPERGLLYWSLYRPGVLPREAADWFGVNRPAVTGLVDGYYLMFAVAVVAGIAFSVAERRWIMFLPVASGAALAATYALFVAEPRYRLTTEFLLFPAAGLGLVRLAASARRLARVRWRRSAPGSSGPWAATERRGLLLTLALAAGLGLAGVLVVYRGQALRARHRWAATVWRVDGQPRAALWRRGAPGLSPVRGTAAGAQLILAAGSEEAVAEVILPGVVLPEGDVNFDAALAWPEGVASRARVSIGTNVVAAPAARLRGRVAWAGGGPARFTVRLDAEPPEPNATSVTVTDVFLTTTRLP